MERPDCPVVLRCGCVCAGQVRFPLPNMLRALKTARHRGISQIWLGLRGPNLATEASFRPPVSEGHFWCLVFDTLPAPKARLSFFAPPPSFNAPPSAAVLGALLGRGLPLAFRSSSS